MSTERRGAEQVRELRLEGGGLFGIAALLVLLVGAAFWLGRWYERQAEPARPATATGDAPAHVAPPVEQAPLDVDRSVTYFDEPRGGQQALEPEREIRPQPSAAEEPRRPAGGQAARAPQATGGDFYVQVFAGRDEQAAAGMVRTLESDGYVVRLFTEREGQSSLYKVRVGGYETRERALAAADALRVDGYPGAWVTQVE
jgi:cell division septation protein DedD